MRFSYEISPKKRGNWRPLVRFSYQLSADEIRHRPYFSRLTLVSGNMNFNYTKSYYKPCRDEIVIEIESNKSGKGEPWALYRNEHRKNSDVHRNVYDAYSFCKDISGMTICDSAFIENEISNSFAFYGPWKPGKEPDYSEIVPVLLEIRDTIRIMQTNGLDSGQNEIIAGEMVSVGNGDDWIGSGTTANVVRNLYVTHDEARQIELD